MKRKSNLRRNSLRRPRHGISLFEVLISMLVAAIGIFGVILLIPFAWETAERGMDRENAINAAKNQFSDFQAYGYHRSEGWFDDVIEDQKELTSFVDTANQLQPAAADLVAAGAPVVQPGSNIVGGWPYVIDPLQAVQQTANAQLYDRFPLETNFSSIGKMPRLNRVNLRDVNGFAFTEELARRMNWQDDDLVFKAPETELGPPRQAYFTLDTIGGVKRQYDGRFATFSFVVPMDDDRQQYRIVTLVGKAGDRSAERVFVLDAPPNGGGANRGYQGILLGGGDVIMTEAAETVPVLQKRPIRNGDWIMLINYHRTDTTQDPTVDPMYDDVQLDFYQVLNASKTTDDPDDPYDPDDDPNEPADNKSYFVTLQGPDFDVFRDWDPTAGVNAATQTVTYAVLIPNVLAVYERTIRAEQASLWTN